MPAIVAVLMGMVTAVFGGVLRDVVCNEIPRVFNDHQPYAICAFAGAWVVVADADTRFAAIARASWSPVRRWPCCCGCSRLRCDWKLPAWRQA